ncbi:MAG TPA: ARMT1-like domain-containing protein, partial [Anaerolineales bacterium]
QLPAHLQQELAGADLIISKGDANYRRLLGDRHWPFTIPAADVLRYAPAPLLAVRVCKSEVVIGLQPAQVEALDMIDAGWKVNGEWGMIQFVNP